MLKYITVIFCINCAIVAHAQTNLPVWEIVRSPSTRARKATLHWVDAVDGSMRTHPDTLAPVFTWATAFQMALPLINRAGDAYPAPGRAYAQLAQRADPGHTLSLLAVDAERGELFRAEVPDSLRDGGKLFAHIVDAPEARLVIGVIPGGTYEPNRGLNAGVAVAFDRETGAIVRSFRLYPKGAYVDALSPFLSADGQTLFAPFSPLPLSAETPISVVGVSLADGMTVSEQQCDPADHAPGRALLSSSFAAGRLALTYWASDGEVRHAVCDAATGEILTTFDAVVPPTNPELSHLDAIPVSNAGRASAISPDGLEHLTWIRADADAGAFTLVVREASTGRILRWNDFSESDRITFFRGPKPSGHIVHVSPSDSRRSDFQFVPGPPFPFPLGYEMSTAELLRNVSTSLQRVGLVDASLAVSDAVTAFSNQDAATVREALSKLDAQRARLSGHSASVADAAAQVLSDRLRVPLDLDVLPDD